MREKINNDELRKGDKVVSVDWMEDKTGVHLQSGTRGRVVGKGSIKDVRVAFEQNGTKHTLEVNRDEIALDDKRDEQI